MAKPSEIEVLTRVLEELDDIEPPKVLRARRREQWVNGAAFAALIVMLMFAAGPLGWPGVIVALITFMLGIFVAVHAFRNVRSREWEVISRFLDRDRIERRIAHLRDLPD